MNVRLRFPGGLVLQAGLALFFLIITTVRLAAFDFPPEIVSRAAVVMDAETGTIVFSKNPDKEIPPASLTKLMTMRLAFQEIAAGNGWPGELIAPSRESWAVNQRPGSSLMHLAPGQTLTLDELFLGLAIQSGNDASTAVALRFAPSVEEFVRRMNEEAAAMGLVRTYFADASGWSADSVTTAREFAEFSRVYIADHPESLALYHSAPEFAFPAPHNVAEAFRANPGTRTQRNRNSLIGRVAGVDGLKTGFIPASGFNISLTAERAGTRFIAVILGAPGGPGGDRIRDADGERLLNWAFDTYRTIRIAPPELPPVRIWRGAGNYAEIVADAPLKFTALRERGEHLTWRLEFDDPLLAPLAAGERVGSLVISDSLGELRVIPLVTGHEAERGGFFKRLFDSMRLFFRRLVS